MDGMATSFKEETVSSVLKVAHVVFDEISFKRTGFKGEGAAKDVKLGIGKEVQKIDEGRYQVSLSVQAIKENEYETVITITGYCEIDEDTPHKDKILNENAIAILFPYVRAELTLITAQPETEPLVIPAVNVNAMLNEERSAD